MEKRVEKHRKSINILKEKQMCRKAKKQKLSNKTEKSRTFENVNKTC